AWSCALCGLTTLSCALALDLALLKAARLFSGAASSAVMTLGMAWVGDVVPYERRQSVLSRLLIGMSLGVTGGILVGGFAADGMFGWRIVFATLAAAFMLVGVALFFLLRAVPEQTQAALQRDSILRISIREYRKILERPWARVLLLTVAVEGILYF